MVAATNIRVEWTALVVGIVLAGLAVAGWRVDGGTGPAPAELSFVMAPSDSLAVSPTGTTLEGSLSPSGPQDGLEGRMSVRNATGSPLVVRVQGVAATQALDASVAVRVSAQGRTVWEGVLGDLRTGMPTGFRLESHETTDMTITAWIPDSADVNAWRARSEMVELRLVTEGVS
jgi:hypothetical protein